MPSMKWCRSGIETRSASFGMFSFHAFATLAICTRRCHSVTSCLPMMLTYCSPPGHHAGVNGLMLESTSCGFCIFNNVAIGALHALATYPKVIRRVGATWNPLGRQLLR